MMKTEEICYILMKNVNGEPVYLDENYCLCKDVRYVLKAGNQITAQILKDEFENHMCRKLCTDCFESGLEIIPLKIIYEW